MDIRLGDRLQMRKPHPCGNNEFLVMRVGADIRIKCLGCGTSVLFDRRDFEKKLKKVIEHGNQNTEEQKTWD